MTYVLSIDQGPKATKAILLDEEGRLSGVANLPHSLHEDEHGWVEFDPPEILENVLEAVRLVLRMVRAEPKEVRAAGVSSQHETVLAWDRKTGEPVCSALSRQCMCGADICEEIVKSGAADKVREATGLALSADYPAAKFAWILRTIPGIREKADAGDICCGTLGTWLIFQLTNGAVFRTDCSSAARTQLYNVKDLKWDSFLLDLFGVPKQCMPEVADTDGDFGSSDFGGILEMPVQIRCSVSDSNGAFFSQECLSAGMTAAACGADSFVMMNIGDQPIESSLVSTSIAWSLDGRVSYVFEGHIDGADSALTWLRDDMHLISSPAEAEDLARDADPNDTTYLVPAFSGLSAPYWDPHAKAAIVGMTHTTGRNEIVKAAVECTAYLVTALLHAMEQGSGLTVPQLHVSGRAARSAYLMQFQSDVSAKPVLIPRNWELSGIGAGYIAGLAAGMYTENLLFGARAVREYLPCMSEEDRERKYTGWIDAVRSVLVD